MSDPLNALTEQTDAWHAARLDALAAGNGWLNLTDRLEIAPGRYSLGQGADNDLRISAGPDTLGQLALQADGTARLTLADGSVLNFASDGESPPHLSTAGVLLEITKVEDQHALRVRDLSLPKPGTLPRINRYPVDPAWRISADWIELATPVDLQIDMVRDARSEVRLTHEARFTHQGQAVTLLATHWKEGKPMFVLRDATSGRETYGASRFLIGDVQGDKIVLDFNRAFNPPCAFTVHAICPLPPRQNILPFAVTAGELAPEFP